VTVCIGAICEGGKIVLVATDRMWTNPYLSIEYEYPEPKIEILSPTCVAAIAGSVILPTEAIERVREKVHRKGIRNISDIAYAIKEEYIKERNKRIDDEVFKPRGLSMDDFYKKGVQRVLDSSLIRMLDSQVERYEFELIILVGGVDKKGHLYVIFPPGRIEPFERVGYVSIGSGRPHVESTFILERYTPRLPLDQALYLVYKAKKIAERAPGVGPSTDIVVITEKKAEYLPDDIKEELQNIYNSEISIMVNRKKLTEKLEKMVKEFRSESLEV